MKPLYDTNILIDFLVGREQARAEFSRHSERAISVITWMEVTIGASPQDDVATRLFLQSFAVIAIDEAIREQAVQVRRARRINLPDAIILASAQAHGLTLVTRNARDFSADDPNVHVPYTI
ncbi:MULTISPECIES: type II toxin-antitoxin system VapC family toxin [Methylobacterium]|uniref:Ribonuclease VapC n=2 Tax=Methylobacterium TaxID=407 RepID=A0A0C6FJB7_9HYPH|nr:type II toxin-antitoxin system VapC family toxin [Methylobacterium aquaticum]BAQ47157.1 twitching motility protein PilT [Methylobacterium aquaticum]